MVNESALRDQRVEHIIEEDGAIPSDADFLPFADVVGSLDWTPDINITTRRGIGTVDLRKFDRGTETHTFSLGYDLQGVIARATASLVNAGPVYDALVRDANNELVRRTVIQRELHQGGSPRGTKRELISVARHAAPNSLVLSGDPAANSPVGVELEYMTPRTRTYLLDQPEFDGTLMLIPENAESLDVTIRGMDGAGSDVRETVTISGDTETTTVWQELYALRAEAEHTGDLTAKRRMHNPIVDYEWTLSGSGTGEYYVTLPGGGNPDLNQPGSVTGSKIADTEETPGSLSAGTWGWGDNDSLGFSTLYVRLDDDSDPDTLADDGLAITNNYHLNPILFRMWGSESYEGIESDLGIPVLPISGDRRTDHAGAEQRFLNNTVTWGGPTLADKINSLELEVSNNIDSQAFLNSLGEDLGAGGRDIVITSTVFGRTTSHDNIDAALQGLIADIVWNLTDSTLTARNAIITDPGSRARDEGNVFANQDVEFTGKTIEVS